MPLLTDENIPRVFVPTLRSGGHDIERAKAIFGEATDDERLLEYCATEGRLLITHDKKDFTGDMVEGIDHPGIIISTEQNVLCDESANAANRFGRSLSVTDPNRVTRARD